MRINIKECFKSSLGIIVLIEIPHNAILIPGMKIRNDSDEIWDIKTVSFQFAISDEDKEPDKICRGYQIEPVKGLGSDYPFNCELIIKSKWEIL